MEDPYHLAIVPDGNRTWAKDKGLPKKAGHYKGIKNAEEIVKYVFGETDVHYLTMYGFSLKNFGREEQEKDDLFKGMSVAGKKLTKWLPDDVGIKISGDMSKLEQYKIPDSDETFRAFCESLERESGSGRYFTILIAYDGAADHDQSAKRMREDQDYSKTQKDYSWVSHLPEVDLVIRTGSQIRLSGFLPILTAYAELDFVDKMWPDFKVQDVKASIAEYKSRHRKFGR